MQYNANNKAEAQAQVDALIRTGASPSASLVAASGYTQEYVDGILAYYRSQMGFSGGTSSGGSYRSNKTSDSGQTQDTQGGGIETTLQQMKWAGATKQDIATAVTDALASGFITPNRAFALNVKYGGT